MDNIPLTLIEAVNSALQDGKSLSWRVHGVGDKIMMNIMWTRTSIIKKSVAVRPIKPQLVVWCITYGVQVAAVTGHCYIKDVVCIGTHVYFLI